MLKGLWSYGWSLLIIYFDSAGYRRLLCPVISPVSCKKGFVLNLNKSSLVSQVVRLMLSCSDILTGCECIHISPSGSKSATYPSACVVTGEGLDLGSWEVFD